MQILNEERNHLGEMIARKEEKLMSKFTLKKEDVDNLLIGLGVLGTGGGGDPEWGRAIIENDFAKGREYEIVDPDDVEDDAFICSGGIMGSVKSIDRLSYKDLVSDWEKDFILIKAFKEMEKLFGKKLDYIIPFEAGGLNTPIIMSLAARMGIPMINADALGRAAPETQMTSFIGHGISLTPMPLVDNAGNTLIVMNSKEPTYADEIGRFVVTKGGGLGANAHYPMTGKQLKNSCVPGVITTAIKIGETITEANLNGVDPVTAFANHFNGIKIFEGVIDSLQDEDKGGFYLVNVLLNGTNEFKGRRCKMVLKNETMAVWVDEQVKCVLPDLACMLDPENGRGIMSTDLKKDKRIAIVAIPCHQRLRETLETEIGRKAFSGDRYGHPELRYQPVEFLNNK